MNTIDHIILIVSAHQHQQVLFNEPVIVKKSPHISIYECWGISVQYGVWLMDENGEWSELDEDDRNAGLVINSIYQRLKSMEAKAA